MKYATNSALFLASMFLVGLPAHADVVPPDTAACSGKQAGAACTYNGATGICQDGTCSRLDYANWDRDASASPPTASYACLKCVTGSVTATATGTDTGSKTATDTATATSTPTTTVTVTETTTPTTTVTVTETATPTATASNTDTATSTPTVTVTVTATTTTTTTTNPPTASNTATASGTNGDEPPADDDGACSIGRGITAKRIAPWVLAASFSLLFLFARRRRR